MSTPQPYQYKNNLTRTNYAAERVQEFFPALSSQDSKIRLLGAKSLREFIEQESRELSSRSFNEIIEKVRKKFADMVNSDNVFVTCCCDKDVSARRGVFHSDNFKTIHTGLKRTDWINFGY